MPGLIEMKPARRPVLAVVWCPNPLMPVASRQVRRLVLTGTDTVDSLVRRLGLRATPMTATLNASTVPRKRWAKRRVHENDCLTLTQQVRGTGAEVKIAFAVFYDALAAAAATYFTQFAVAVALNVLANALTKSGQGNSGKQEATPDVFSIAGGANEARPYGPLPLVLGEHRVFADYASRPFGEFVVGGDTEVVNNTPRFEDMVNPAFGFSGMPAAVDPPWTLIGSGAGIEYYGDNAARSFNSPSGPQTPPHTFVVRYFTDMSSTTVTDYESYLIPDDGFNSQNFRPLGTTIAVLVGYGYVVSMNTERLTSIFNFGFGDIDISDIRIGPTPITRFNAYQLDYSVVPTGMGDRTELTGYTTPGWVGDMYPGNVQEVEGGKLEQNADVENSGWIERQGSVGCKFIQVDIAGRLFRQGDGGLENLSCVIEAEYQEAGSMTWVPFAFSPETITNGSTTPVRTTYSEMLAVDALRVRVRRTTPDPTDAKDVSELEFVRIKWFRNTDALYPAQTRMGLQIRATGQLNGRIDRLSALVKVKHWVWDSSDPWEPDLFPGDDAAPWTWGFTVNPAWLFLYYARGGYLNATAEPDYLGLQGWLDRPDASNGQRLFGAGLTNDRIDYAAIVAWGQFCEAAGLECRLELFAQRSAGAVLDDIAAAGRASKTWATGKLGVVWETAGQPVVAAFGMSNILAGTFRINYDSDNSVDEYALEYTRSDDDYNSHTVFAVVPGANPVVNQKTERAAFSMPNALAQRLVNLLAADKHFHRRTITFEAGEEALRVTRGEVVHLAHDLTQWAHSGRLVALQAEGELITEVTLSVAVENPTDAETYHVWVRLPSSVYVSVECVPPVGRTNVLQVLGEWPLVLGPGVLGQGLDTENALSTWPDSLPEDFIFFAGPLLMPGKRARIVAVEPISQRRVRITCRDEYEAYYPLEFSLVDPPAPVSGEQRIARAFNLAIEPRSEGGHRLSWELEAAHGADVMLSVNGGAAAQVPVNGFLTVAGTEVLLPAYPPGTTLAIELLPVPAGTPVAIQGDSLEVTV